MLASFEVIPDHTISKHLGLINLFIIRETTALYEVSHYSFHCVTSLHHRCLCHNATSISLLSLSLFVTSACPSCHCIGICNALLSLLSPSLSMSSQAFVTIDPNCPKPLCICHCRHYCH